MVKITDYSVKVDPRCVFSQTKKAFYKMHSYETMTKC